MEKWIDHPASEDLIEKYVELGGGIIKQHASQLAKFAPPIAGFAIFLLYFHANHFYPSFDLLQFSSLLLSASMVGFAIIGWFFFTLLLPGWWVFHSFINRPDIRNAIKAALPEEEKAETRKIIWLLLLLFPAPYCLTSLLLSFVLTEFAGMYTASLWSLSLLASLFVGILLQFSFRLPTYSFARYAFYAWLSVMLVNVMAFALIKDTTDFLDQLHSERLKLLAFYLIPLGVCILAAICSLVSFAGLKFSAPFSLLFALVIALYSGVLAGLPQQVMQQLGLGNYQASRVVLDPDYCDATLSKELKLSSDCQLTDVHVVWSLGETYTFILGQDEAKRQVNIPARFIKAFVRAVK